MKVSEKRPHCAVYKRLPGLLPEPQGPVESETGTGHPAHRLPSGEHRASLECLTVNINGTQILPAPASFTVAVTHRPHERRPESS